MIALIQILSSLLLVFCLYLFARNTRLAQEAVLDAQKKINHQALLLDIVSQGLCSPIHRFAYDRIREIGYKKDLSIKDVAEIIREKSLEVYNHGRKQMVEWINTIDDPAAKEKYKMRLNEADTVMTLLDTVDDNTSDEQVKIIMTNIMSSIRKMQEIDRGDYEI